MAQTTPPFMIHTNIRFCSLLEPQANKNTNGVRNPRPFYGAAIPLIDLPDELQHVPDIKVRIDAARDSGNDLYHIRSSFAPVFTLRDALERDCPDPDALYAKLERQIEICKFRRIPPDRLFDGMKAELRVTLVTMDEAPAPYTGKQFLAIDEVIFNLSDVARAYRVEKP